jgi:ribulose-5-phosphate 4-epimerase/fuculose-1-phosphate aldolase
MVQYDKQLVSKKELKNSLRYPIHTSAYRAPKSAKMIGRPIPQAGTAWAQSSSVASVRGERLGKRANRASRDASVTN